MGIVFGDRREGRGIRQVKTNLSLGGNDLALTNTLCGSCHRQRFLQVLAENDILDEHALNLDTPTSGDLLDDLSNGLGDLLTALNDILQDASTNDVAQGSLSALDKGLADVGDAEGGLVRADDVVIDDRGQVQGDIVLCHADLLRNLDDLDLDVDLDDALGQRVDLDQTGVDGLVETAELGDEANVALVDVLVGVGAANAAWHGAEGTNDGSQAVDC